ncbi:hypothetical protein PSACC_03558 [Paramicrosporidium saccamoebae]|uniref:Uncharacterized protein n=1 Tax=Paramicrosporidium saccamoebae TaxID=1246581 RepID=A0A2H9TFY4_9FUNG|nr:hypothetical protein PSACC_03558 [Paramicrosporidium saccamoebae]
MSTFSVNAIVSRATLLVERVGRCSLAGYHRARYVVQGPMRNAALVGREFARTVGRERQYGWPREGLWQQAKLQYAQAWNTLFPTTIREQGKWAEALAGRVKELTWKQVGEGTLVVGEIISIYYMSKLLAVSGKKTIQTFI